MAPCILIFGFGYTAYYISQILNQQGFRIIGTSRDPLKKTDSLNNQYELISFTHDEIKSHLPFVTHILSTCPPNHQINDPVLHYFSDLLKSYNTQIEWLGYLSSTGVYGNHDGDWVNEFSVPQSPGSTGQLRLDAEVAWHDFALQKQLPLHTFRLAGIYGPKKNALERILSGKSYSIYKPNHYFSRIHVEDIATIISTSIKQIRPFSIYNIADDLPTPSHEIDWYACKLLQRSSLPLMNYNAAKLSSREQEFYASNRRILNTKIKKELNVQLNYPTYHKGLNNLLLELAL